MTEVAHALNEVRELYARFLGQPVPELGPGRYAPFPPGSDPVRFAVQEVEDLKRLFAQVSALPFRRSPPTIERCGEPPR